MLFNYIGQKINISFNIRYVMDILSKINSDIIEISLYNDNSKGIFQLGTTGAFRYIHDCSDADVDYFQYILQR